MSKCTRTASHSPKWKEYLNRIKRISQVANPEAKTLFLYPGICHWLNSYFVHLVLHARLVRAAFPHPIGLHLKQRKQARILNPCETNSRDQRTALWKGAEIFWELIFFLWFQLEVETFQVGVGCPCRGGRPKKKLEGGWGGGRSASPPDALAEHAAWFAFGSYNFWGLRFIKDLVLCSKTCRFLIEFLGPEVFFFVSCVYIFCWSQAHQSFGILGSQLIWALILIYYLGLHKTFGVLCWRARKPLWLINKNFRQKVTTQAAKAATNSQDATKQQLLRNRCRNKKKDQCNTEARKHQMSKK